MTEPYEHILKSYTDVSLVKEGGQKAVYTARDAQGGRIIVKIGQYPSLNSLERIRREVEVLQGLDSPYYPKNIDFRTEPPNFFIIAEEYVDSRPLVSCLTEFTDALAALSFLKQLVLGLTVIWRKRIVHRDLKPDNILVLPDRSPKIIDLGIARLLDEESLTRTLNARGPCTPAYASPEQLKNRKAQIDQRTDQFALGIVFAQLLLGGAHPFDPNVVGTGDAIVANILAGNWARPRLQKRIASSAIHGMVERLLGAEPFNRYRTAENLLDAIESCEVDVR